MKSISVEIKATFGSKFQERFARDSLMAALKAWRQFLKNSHKNNVISVTVGNDAIDVLEWFNFEKTK